MTVMYIACDNCMERGYFLGDVIVCCRVAHLFVENENPDGVILSIHEIDRLNFIWDSFVERFNVLLVQDRWHKGNGPYGVDHKGDFEAQYENFDKRRKERVVEGLHFETYKELYPRLDGGNRQQVLCGSERGIGRANIFEYYYYGQESFKENPIGTRNFGPTNIRWDECVAGSRGEIYLAPHEKCQGNKHFTHKFWDTVGRALLEEGFQVTVNDQGNFMPGCESNPKFRRVFPDFPELFTEIQGHSLVLTGNCGVGWVAAATGTPFIACEKDLNFVEYSYEKCGCESLVETIDQPDPDRMVRAVKDWRYANVRDTEV